MSWKCCRPASSTVPPRALTSSVTLNVSDGVDNEEGVTESESDDSEAQERDESDNDYVKSKAGVCL